MNNCRDKRINFKWMICISLVIFCAVGCNHSSKTVSKYSNFRYDTNSYFNRTIYEDSLLSLEKKVYASGTASVVDLQLTMKKEQELYTLGRYHTHNTDDDQFRVKYSTNNLMICYKNSNLELTKIDSIVLLNNDDSLKVSLSLLNVQDWLMIKKKMIFHLRILDNSLEF